ncbi:hypothetical protein GCM10023082_42900 [Streptomyces tremellae]|uniref:Uncharacterized protein n=1 Tax=Streptomyces tremellae TaxID=1124239 RepID=A0ABP7FMB8_9ACTN
MAFILPQTARRCAFGPEAARVSFPDVRGVVRVPGRGRRPTPCPRSAQKHRLDVQGSRRRQEPAAQRAEETRE